ncbi:MAG: hypothetical protein Q9217_000162 [Psora testacea]
MNFSKGILECRQQHYRHLRKLLKSIPLNAPTDIELSPRRFIKVTLLDANHCAGAVMFLIQDEAKAILYTGDIRSEPWWVETLLRNPVIIPYAQGLRRLDKIYLDTTFATKDGRYRRFPSKAKGLSELLQKVKQYPPQTVFHFHAWTFGYEEVWIALSNALSSQVHVDPYKCLIYQSLSTIKAKENPSYEGSALFGFQCGNRYQPGCLTDRSDVRLHSCADGTDCPALSSPETVFVTPIISRSPGGDILPELSASGAGGDLIQSHDLEVEDEDAAMKFAAICKAAIPDHFARSAALKVIAKALLSENKVSSIEALHLDDWKDDITLHELARRLAKIASTVAARYTGVDGAALPPSKKISKEGAVDVTRDGLPRRIVFPYSRHSSYEELCHLVGALRPADVYPCTTDEESWSGEVSVRNIFGKYCSGSVFAHDQKMETLLHEKATCLPQKRRREPAEQHLRTLSEKENGGLRVEDNASRHVNMLRTTASSKGHIHSTVEQIDASIGAQSLPSLTNANERDSIPKTADISPASQLYVPYRRMRKIRSTFLDYLKDANQQEHDNRSVPLNGSNQTLEAFGKQETSRIPSEGSEAEPIRLRSEDDATCRTTTREGSFQLQQMPEPDSLPTTSNNGSNSHQETQVSLSDAAFDSQVSQPTAAEEQATRIQHRKEAYVAAKELSNSWRLQVSLVSSSGNHGEEELEL